MDDARRQVLTEACEKLRRDLRDILNPYDPRGLISSRAPDDEYEPELATILPRLTEASAVEDVRRILYEEFANWFGAEEVPAEGWFEGPRSRGVGDVAHVPGSRSIGHPARI